MDIVIGCDIGGSHITTCLIDLKLKTLIEDTVSRKMVDSKRSLDTITSEWVECIQNSLSKRGIQKAALGIAIPAPFDYEKGICWIKDQNKFNQLYGINLKELLADQLTISTSTILMANDARCFLLGEMGIGAGKGHNTSLGITLGTGLGSSAMQNLEVIDADLWNSAFKNSIAEDYISTRWFLDRYYEMTGIKVGGVKELAEQANKSQLISSLFEDFGKNLAEFILKTLESNKYDTPEIIILGGNISQSSELFLPSTQTFLMEKGVHIPIEVAKLGELSAIYGAASLCEEVKSFYE